MKTFYTITLFTLTVISAYASRSGAATEASESVLFGAAVDPSGPQAKDGGRDAVDVALDYVSSRISQVKKANTQLSSDLNTARHNGADAREKLSRAEMRLTELPKLRMRESMLLTEKNSALSQLSAEWNREKMLSYELQNASLTSMKRGRMLARARVRLSKELRAEQELSHRLRNATNMNSENVVALAHAHKQYSATMASSTTKDQQLATTRNFINQMRTALHDLQQREKADATGVEKATLAKEKAVQLEREEGYKVKDAKREDAALRKALLELGQKARQDVLTNKEYASELAREQKQAQTLEQDQKDSQQRRKEEQEREHQLRQEVLELSSKLSSVEKATQQAQDQAKEAKDDLQTAQAESQEVQGTVPWLQDKVAQEKALSENATSEMREAMKERDESKQQLALARQKIVTLEQQYAEIVKMVGKSVAEGNGQEDQSNVSALTKLVHGAVEGTGSVTVATDTASSPAMDSIPDDTLADTDEITADPTPSATAANPALRGQASLAPIKVADGAASGLEKDSAGLEEMLSTIVPDVSQSS